MAQAQAGQEILNVSDQLAANDPKDRMRTESYAKVFKADLKAGVGYTIDLVSTDFDTYLRLEDMPASISWRMTTAAASSTPA